MTLKRLALVAGCLLLGSLLGWWTTRSGHRIDLDALKQIKLGMSIDDVESVFCALPGDYTTKPVWYASPPEPIYRAWQYKNPARIWTTNEIQVRIHFDDNGRVQCVV